jgi:hypothetical protein
MNSSERKDEVNRSPVDENDSAPTDAGEASTKEKLQDPATYQLTMKL